MSDQLHRQIRQNFEQQSTLPVGTIIGICGILWLGKGGDAMTAAPDQTTNDTAPQK